MALIRAQSFLGPFRLPVVSFPPVNLTSSLPLPSAGADATREQLMQVLQRLDGLYIKGTYLVNQLECTISNVTLSMAVEYGDPNYDRPASSVEECACPSSYTGQAPRHLLARQIFLTVLHFLAAAHALPHL